MKFVNKRMLFFIVVSYTICGCITFWDVSDGTFGEKVTHEHYKRELNKYLSSDEYKVIKTKRAQMSPFDKQNLLYKYLAGLLYLTPKKELLNLDKDSLVYKMFKNYGVLKEKSEENIGDDRKAARIFKTTYKAGLLDGINRIGEYYLYNSLNNFDKKYDKAFRWFIRGRAFGSLESYHNLAVMFYHGYEFEPHKELALKYFKKAAAKGHIHSLYNLGVMYYHGHAVRRSESKALEYFKESADGGCEQAAYVVMRMFLAQHKKRKIDFEIKSINYYNYDCAYYTYYDFIRLEHYLKKDKPKYKSRFRPIIKSFARDEILFSKDYYKIFTLGMCYHKGMLFKKDLKKAYKIFCLILKSKKWQVKAALLKKRHISFDTLYQMGELYQQSENYKNNHAKTTKYFVKACDYFEKTINPNITIKQNRIKFLSGENN